jgi:hypothetical protein
VVDLGVLYRNGQGVTQDHPAMQLGALGIWVRGRQLSESEDYSDGNWLNVFPLPGVLRLASPSRTIPCTGAEPDMSGIPVPRADRESARSGSGTLGGQP